MSRLGFVWQWFRGGGKSRTPKQAPRSRPRAAGGRLAVEALEDRTLLSVSFGPPATLAVGLQPGPVVTADLGNGHQDIVVLNQGQFPARASSVSVLLGNGDGTFQPAITTSLLPGATSIAVGDFNRDGKLDLAITSGLNNAVEILRGNGDGTFQTNPLIISVGTQQNFLPSIQSVAVGDFLHNGKLDLAVANPGSNTVSVLLGNGDGTFQPRVDYAVGALPLSVAAVDLGNGQIDLVVANHDSSNVSVLVGNGDGTFQPARNIDVKVQAFGLDSHPLTLQVGDFNGDGKPDLLLSQFVGFDAGESFVTVLPGKGDGAFQAPITRDAGFGLIGLAVGDFDGNGKLDFAAAGPAVSEAVVFAGNGDGSFGILGSFPSGGANPFGVATGDFNGDGRPDLVVANTFSNIVGVLLSTSAPAATATALAVDANPAIVGQTETLTATVNAQAGTPSGTVAFLDGNTMLGTATVNANSQAVLTVSLGVGNHALTASFAGTDGFSGSISPVVTETVNRAATTVALNSSVNPALTGQAVTFTATVAAVEPGTGTPTGTVTFLDGNVILGTVAVGAGGSTTFTTSFAAAGAHAITAVYNSDPNFVGSSQALTEQVNAATTPKATTTALFASANSIVVGQAVTFMATVRDPAGTGTPTGTVTFFLGSVAVATVKLDANGQAHLTGFFTGKGTFTLKAIYNGDASFAASSSQSFIEQVN
jgi:hypothetical protein